MSDGGEQRSMPGRYSLPMAVTRPSPRTVRQAPPSVFLAQLLSTHQASPLAGPEVDARDRDASSTYRKVEASDVKRLPLGYRKSLSA